MVKRKRSFWDMWGLGSSAGGTKGFQLFGAKRLHRLRRKGGTSYRRQHKRLFGRR